METGVKETAKPIGGTKPLHRKALTVTDGGAREYKLRKIPQDGDCGGNNIKTVTTHFEDLNKRVGR